VDEDDVKSAKIGQFEYKYESHAFADTKTFT
jgi:hypothetical protein